MLAPSLGIFPEKNAVYFSSTSVLASVKLYNGTPHNINRSDKSVPRQILSSNK